MKDRIIKKRNSELKKQRKRHSLALATLYLLKDTLSNYVCAFLSGSETKFSQLYITTEQPVNTI